jgi:hypothetical protein
LASVEPLVQPRVDLLGGDHELTIDTTPTGGTPDLAAQTRRICELVGNSTRLRRLDQSRRCRGRSPGS